MKQTNLRRKKLAVTISLLMSTFAAAYAQDENNNEDNTPPAEATSEENAELGTLTVTGIQRSLQESKAVKMESDSIVEAVSAEDIGKLPDVSIAESLARLPGLTAQRLNGRGQVISVRGLSPDFSTALLNGREQVSAGDNRGVEFDQYPSELLSSVVVYKTPDASLIGQGLSGTADLRTVRPLEYGQRAVAANFRYTFNEFDALNADADDTGERFSASYIDQNNDGTIGYAFGFAHMSTPTQGERFNAWGYPTTGDDLVIGGSKPFVQTVDLDRNGLIGVLEFQPSDTFSTSIDLYYSEFEETQLLRGIELPLFWSTAQLQPGFTVEDGLVTQGVFNDVKGVIRNDLNARDAELWAAGWNAEWVLNDDWTAEVDLSHSEIDRQDILLESYSGTGPAGEGLTDNLGFSLAAGQGTVFSPSLDYTDPNNIFLTSPQGWGGDIIPGGQQGYMNRPTISDELTHLKLSAKRFLNGAVSSVEFGVDLGTREKGLVADEFFLALADGSDRAAIPIPTSVTQLSYLGIPGMLSYNPLALIDNGVYSLVRNPNADVVIKSWNVEEDVNLAYVKFGIDTVWGSIPVRGNFGTQIVHTDQGSTALAASGTGADTQSVPISGGKSYTEILPSVNLIFEFDNSQFLRFGLARTLARPRMDQLRASSEFSFNVTNLDSTDVNNSPWSANGGNPELDPWIANAVDISYEKYFDDDVGYFAAAVFYKDLESYIFEQPAVFDFSGFPTGGLTPALTQGLVTIPQNGEGGNIKGVELSASVSGSMFSEALSGFGAIFNAAFTDSNIQSDPNSPSTPLPGLSEEVINLTLYYENNGWSARVSDRYRSDFLGEVAGFGNGRNLRTVEAESVVDAQLSYTFQSGPLFGLTVLLTGSNLTDEPFVTVQDGDGRQVIDYQSYGRTFSVGASYRF